MAPMSEEEENYIRLILLLKGVQPKAVRYFFDKEFPPSCLLSELSANYTTLYGLKRNRVLSQAQWNLLFPSNGMFYILRKTHTEAKRNTVNKLIKKYICIFVDHIQEMID